MSLQYYFHPALPMTTTTELQAFHFDMFHGMGLVGGVETVLTGERSLHCFPSQPIELIRNIHSQPQCFMLFSILIVSESVRARLRKIKGLEFVPVEYRILFDFPYSLGTSPGRYQADERYTGLRNLAKRYRCVPPPNFGAYYECIMNSMASFKGRTISVKLQDTCRDRQLALSIPNKESRLDCCKAAGGIVASASFMEQIQPFFRPPYFCICKLGETGKSEKLRGRGA